MGALHHVPAEVDSAPPGRDDVDLFPAVLPHVGDIEEVLLGVEAEAPGVAQPVGPNLTAGAALAGEGVVGGDRVGVAPVDVETQQVAEQRAAILTVAVRVPAASAVTHADVEHAVLAEEDVSSI